MCSQWQDLSSGCLQRTPNLRKWHLQSGFTALTSSSPVNNDRRWQAEPFYWWNNKSLLPRASIPACWHKHFLMTEAQTCTRCAIPESPSAPSQKDRLPRGVVYYCYQKYSGLFTVSLQPKMCWQGLSQKRAETVLGKLPVALESGLKRAQDFTKSSPQGKSGYMQS